MGIGAAVAIGGATLAAGVIGSQSAEKAAKTQAKAAGRATDAQLQMFREGQEATAPWRERGKQALDELAALQGLEGVEAQDEAFGRFRTSPGYQFQLEEAQRASDRAASARGGFESGAQIRRLQEIAQGTAAMDYGNYVSRLQSLSGLGQTSAEAGAGRGLMVGQNVGQNYISAGQAAAQNQIQQGQIFGQTLQQGAQLYGLYKGGYFDRPPAQSAVGPYGMFSTGGQAIA